MITNLSVLAATCAHLRINASEMLIQQQINLQMDAEKRLKHNRFEMEKCCFRAAGYNLKKSKKEKNHAYGGSAKKLLVSSGHRSHVIKSV